VTGTFTALVQRRWVDLDAQGHVNNTLVADHLQEARTQLLMRADLASLLERGCVVVSHHVEYLSPILFRPAPLRVEVAVGEVGAARFEIDYVVWDADVRCARARTVLCPYDLTVGLPRRLTPAERAGLAAYRPAGAAAADALAAQGFTPLRDLPMVPLAGRGEPYPTWVRWSDLDRYGHVNNVRLFDYVQEARIAAMERMDRSMARLGSSAWGDGGTAASAGESPLMWLVARQDVAYLSPVAHRGEPYEMRTQPVKIGTTSMTLVAELVDPLNDGAVLARSATIVVCADATTGRPTPLPGGVRALFEES